MPTVPSTAGLRKRKAGRRVEDARPGLPRGGDELSSRSRQALYTGSTAAEKLRDQSFADVVPMAPGRHIDGAGAGQSHGSDVPPDSGDASLAFPTTGAGHALPHGNFQFMSSSDHYTASTWTERLPFLSVTT